jgi:hypothetical protein
MFKWYQHDQTCEPHLKLTQYLPANVKIKKRLMGGHVFIHMKHETQHFWQWKPKHFEQCCG